MIYISNKITKIKDKILFKDVKCIYSEVGDEVRIMPLRYTDNIGAGFGASVFIDKKDFTKIKIK